MSESVPAPPLPVANGLPPLLSLAANERPHVILHLGAGEGGELDAYLASEATHVALVEPNPASLRRLRQRAAALTQAVVHPLAIAAETGRATLRVFNLGDLSSLRAPTELAVLFPGLRQVATHEVDTADMASLLAGLPDPAPVEDREASGHPPRPDWLVIDTPGEEATVIDGLARAGAGHRFDRIFLHCGTTALYEGSTAAQTLRDRLEAAGYGFEGVEETDPDRPCLRFRLDRTRLENAALHKALAERNEAFRELAGKCDWRGRRIAELEDELEAQKAARTEAETARDQLETHLQAETTTLAERNEAFRELTGKCDWRGRRIAELEETLKRTQHLQDQAAAQARKLQEDLTLALRLQSLAQSDLRELQQRHAEVLATRDRQADLLRQLTPRLQEAARYLGALRSLPESEATPTPASLPKDTPDRRDKGSGKAKAGKTKGAKRDKATRSSRPQV